ncbi:MAG: sigma-70 family RNA polymerase sigma factor [Verrucomicrobiales bacterium]|nr:sigma-70 family RNA polymerase sigma factor [Verrucomicrobiales bacterium]
MNDDLQLLGDYAERGSEAAFRALVERHLPMVMGVARRATRDEALSEEIAQTAFLLLAKKAAGIGRGTILSGWLYRTTSFVAARALRAETRRSRREREALSMPMNETLTDDWLKVREALDQALMELAESDRNAIISRFWEARSFREVGGQLGIAEEAAKKRVARALEKLRGRLAKLGVEVGTAALMAGLSRERAEAMVPNGLSGRTLENALGGRWGRRAAGWGLGGWTGYLGVSAPSWAPGLAAWVSAGALVVVAWWCLHEIQTPPPDRAGGGSIEITASASAQARRSIARSEPQLAELVTTPSGTLTAPLGVRLRVVEREGDVPVAGAEVRHTGLVTRNPVGDAPPLRTDSNGWVRIDALSGSLAEAGLDRVHQFQAWVRAVGFASREVMWLSTTGNVLRTMTSDYVVRLDRGIRAGGLVVDDRGQPIANAVIGVVGSDYQGYTVSYDSAGQVTTPPEVRAEDFPSYYLPPDPRARGAVLTDRQGRFVLEDFPKDLASMILEVVTVDESRRRFDSAGSRSMTAEKLATFDVRALREGSLRLEVPRSISIAGRVVDPQGQPVIDARVTLGVQVGNLEILARTNVDVQGEFRVAVGEEREVILTATAPGFAETSRLVWASRPSVGAQLVMEAERPLRGRVVDIADQPVSGARISWTDSGRQGRASEWATTSDASGRFVWESAPRGELQLVVSSDGYPERLVVLEAGDEERVIRLGQGSPGITRIEGTVVDAETGESIPKFGVAFAWEDPADSASGRFRELEGTDGHFQSEVRASDFLVGSLPAYVVMVTAADHEPFVSRRFALAEGDQQLTLRMARGGVVAGVVRTPEGDPAVGARMVMAQPGKPVFTHRPGEVRKSDAISDEHGAFRMVKAPGGRGLLIVHASGYYVAPLTGDLSHLEVRLVAWARLKGALRPWAGPLAHQTIHVDPVVTSNELGIYWGTSVVTDEKGSFEFPKLPTGEFRVGHQPAFVMRPGMPTLLQSGTTVAMREGETSDVDLGGAGRSVLVNLRTGAGSAGPLITNLIVALRQGAGIEEFDPWKYNTRQSQENARKEFDRRQAVAQRGSRTQLGCPDSAGRVCFEAVAPGRYTLEARVSGAEDSAFPRALACVLRVEVEVPELEGGGTTSGPLVLGDFMVALP